MFQSCVGLFASFCAQLPNIERLHHNNEELQCTAELTWKLRNSVSTGLTQVKSTFFLLFLSGRAADQAWPAERENAIFTHHCSEPNCIFKCGCQSFHCVKSLPVMILSHPHWLSVLRSGVRSPSSLASWQDVYVQGTNLPSLEAVSWGFQSEAKGQNKGLRLQIEKHFQPFVDSVAVLILFARNCQTIEVQPRPAL